ncbi:MAG: recombinase family protein [Bryobacteraceae bacterium]
MNETAPVVRCAIYTRKSTEEGLEQEFNTLQAQREAAEAYILSQKQNGWHTLVKSYNDGGFSGASLDRPALKQLLDDIEARQIDCVVVYKVDRLSRSLLDFTRLLSLFEKRSVSFVSVTQEFNTTTSMGRLTLNILLSFAQFEREIISERTRDKMSAARRKGKWVGGAPVLGYDVDPQGGRLVVNEAEAERVREIFTICAGCPTLAEAQRQVTARGLRTRDWTSERGRQHPGNVFTPSKLAALVSNVLYIGQIRHKGVVYGGEQVPIVDRELWSQVQAQLKLTPGTGARQHQKLETLLAGLLYCGQCREPMGASFASPRGCRHIYYVCRTGKRRQPRCGQKPVAASDLESSLFEKLEPILGAADRSTLLLEQSLQRLTYNSDTREVRVTLRDGSRFQYLLPIANRPGVRHTSEPQAEQGRVPRVSRLMALAIKFQRLVDEGAVRNYAELAALGQVTRPRLCQIMMLANLAPAIQEALLFLPKTVRGPDRVTEKQLRHIARTVDWEAQQRLFRSCCA